MLLLYPGQKSDMVSLQECLRQAHDELRADRAKEIAERKKVHAPLDDGTDWRLVAEAQQDLIGAVAAKATVAVVSVCARVMQLAAGNAIEEIAPYEPDPELDGVRVQFLVMSDGDRRDLIARMSDGWRAARDAALSGATQEQQRAIDEQIMRAQEDMLRKGLSAVLVGGEHPERIDDIEAAIPAFRRSGLHGPLFRAVRAFQDMPAKKAMRFGLPPQSTSAPTTTAPGAQSSDAAYSAAMEVGSPISGAHHTRPPHAPGVTSSTM